MLKKFYVIVLAYILCVIWAFCIEKFLIVLNYPTITIIEAPSFSNYDLFFVIIFAPLWEELAYRYAPLVITNKINSDLLLPVVVLTSIWFGWGHGEAPEGVLLQGVLGFIFAFVYIKNGFSYWSSVTVHALYNLTVTFF